MSDGLLSELALPSLETVEQVNLTGRTLRTVSLPRLSHVNLLQLFLPSQQRLDLEELETAEIVWLANDVSSGSLSQLTLPSLRSAGKLIVQRLAGFEHLELTALEHAKSVTLTSNRALAHVNLSLDATFGHLSVHDCPQLCELSELEARADEVCPPDLCTGSGRYCP